MKKMLGILTTSAILVFSAALPVSAADDKRQTKVSASVSPAYVVTIPTSVKVPFNSIYTDFGRLELTSAKLAPYKCVKVTMFSDNLLDHTEDASKVIPYTICQGTPENVGELFQSASYLTEGDKTDLTIHITQDDWNKTYAGEYEDTVTFQIEYTNR